MSEKDSFFSQFDESWDAENALNARTERYRAAEEGLTRNRSAARKQTAPQRPARKQPAASASTGNPQRRGRKPGKKKRKANIKGWLILIGIALVLLALLVGLIVLIVSWFTPEEAPATTTQSVVEELTEPTSSKDEIIAAVIEGAERLAAGYDYDAAIAALGEYGAAWQQEPELLVAQERFTEAKNALVRWDDTTEIPHISFRALIVDTGRAFDGDDNEVLYNQTMLTVKEFKAILQELYDGDYVLVSIYDMITNQTEEKGAADFKQGDIYLPPEKKPIVLSQEDVNYARYRVDGNGDGWQADAQGDGFACKLLLDENGELTCQYVDAQGNVLYGAYDLVPILEEFIEKHPDFSYRGARGILSVSGSEGVFGYQTHPDWEDVLGKDAYMTEIRQAQAMVAALKERGWVIASQGYSAISFSSNSADTIAENLTKWENQVEPIVGKTDILIYPSGSDIGGVNYYSGDKFNTVYKAGYRIFCNMDSAQYWVQLRSNYLRQARRVVDGYRMEYGASALSDLFDVSKVIDSARPRPVPSL